MIYLATHRVSFQSTPSAWRETITPDYFFRRFYISIHSLRMEGDQCLCVKTERSKHFNPLPPHGGRRSYFSVRFHISSKFQSTPSAWRETNDCFFFCVRIDISIHSLRMEGDMFFTQFRYFSGISIHSLRMEGDLVCVFQHGERGDFNPLPPHGGRPSPENRVEF